MKSFYLQTYRQPLLEVLELDSTGICAGSGNPTFNPSQFDGQLNW